MEEGWEADEGRVREKYARLVRWLIREEKTVTTMESCTSGLIATLLTDTEGASKAFRGAFVTYSNEAKVRCGVPEKILKTCGVYSKETAEAMAGAAKAAYRADIGIGVTGTFSNPDPENQDSSPGEVYFAVVFDEEVTKEKLIIPPLSARWRYKLYVAERVIDRLLDAVSLGCSVNA